jgi:hypothetical protein
MTSDPFRVLGLPTGPDLTDDDVRAAWRRVAAATHPDRADGGDPAVFATAAGAYSDLRTPFGRNEALADLATATGPATTGPAAPGRTTEAQRPGLAGLPGYWAVRVRHGRPARLALRLLAAAAVSALVVIIAGWQPATPALMVGALTWVIRSGRRDLAASPPDGG